MKSKTSVLFVILLFLAFIVILIVPTGSQNTNSDRSGVAQETSPEKSMADLNKLAEKYCSKRRGASRSYPVLDLEEGSGGSARVVPEKFKQGTELSIEDCYKALNYLTLVGKDDNLENIANQIRWIGMDNIELLYSAGLPDDVNTTTTQNGSQEQWVYKGGGSHTMYVYLENKVVTSWQDF